MRKIILDLAVTLDGFIEGPNGEIDWCYADDDSGLDTFVDSIDTIFYGRISYDLWGNYQPAETDTPFIKKLYEMIHQKKKYVFSSTRSVAVGDTVFLDSVSRENIESVRELPGKDIWLYGGGSLITSFINLGLVDIYRLGVFPVILGAGKPLFSGIQNRVGLELINTTSHPSGVVLLEYQPKKTFPG